MTPDHAVPAARCAAGVTVYKPDEAILFRLLDRLDDEGVPALVHVDGPTGEAVGENCLAKLRSDPHRTVLQSERNGGIGRALNRLASLAHETGRDRILFLDQDSDLAAGTVAALAVAFDEAERRGSRVAAIGPKPVAPPGEAIQPPRYRRRPASAATASLAGVDFLITSGSLVALDAWRTIGPFREDYFIDAIDVEWCFRAWRRGYEVLLHETVELPHRVGAGVVRFGPLAFPRQTERRMLSYARNQGHMLRLAHVPLRWKLRTLLYVPLQIAAFACHGPERPKRFHRLLRAALGGLRGRPGLFDGER